MFRRSGVKNSLVESFNKCVLFYRSFSENWTQKQMEKILRMQHVFTQFLPQNLLRQHCFGGDCHYFGPRARITESQSRGINYLIF